MFIISACIALLFPVFSFELSIVIQALIYAGGGVFIGIIVFLKRLRPVSSDPVRPAFVWLFIIHLYYPVAAVLSRILPFSFMGVTYLPVTVFLLIMIKIRPQWKPHGRWFRAGRFTITTIGLIAAVAVVSGAALYLWVRLIRPDLSDFLAQMPEGGPVIILLAGLGFALTNAFVEEMLFRGYIWHGLEGNKTVQFLFTAFLFGLLHFRGFPGGFIGMGMVVVWGIFLAMLRRRSGAILAPYLAHVAADMTIFGILCGLYY